MQALVYQGATAGTGWLPLADNSGHEPVPRIPMPAALTNAGLNPASRGI